AGVAMLDVRPGLAWHGVAAFVDQGEGVVDMRQHRRGAADKFGMGRTGLPADDIGDEAVGGHACPPWMACGLAHLYTTRHAPGTLKRRRPPGEPDGRRRVS